MLLMTNIIPWGELLAEGPFAGVSAAIVSIQFTFRLLGPVSLMLVFLACMALEDLRALGVRASQVAAAGFVAFALIEGGATVTSFLTSEPYYGTIFEFDPDDDQYYYFTNVGVMPGEYMPDGALDHEPPAPHAYDGVREYAITEEGSKLAVSVVVGDEPGAISLGRLAYAQYRVEPDADFEGSCALTEMMHTLLLQFSAGSHGKVTVWFDVPVSWNVALGVTYATVIVLAAYVLWSRASRKRPSTP